MATALKTGRGRAWARRRVATGALLLALAGTAAAASIDLRNANVERFDNGLTLITLEDARFPVVSVQALYRVGARDEVTGKTGLAHFLEHMAFRDSANFPGTDLVSRIYAIGGEWHGYTWIDQTTYFATVPKAHLDLLLDIEAERLSRLLLNADDMEAERGAVLAEMHMYENDPASQLIDAVNFTSFLAHPYRNNTIGWESDIEGLTHSEVVDFYRAHYVPANLVLAVVGDIDAEAVRAGVERRFGNLASGPATPPPRTVEPPQNGLRRIVVHGESGAPQFRVAWRAPSATSPDFAGFLVLQAVLGQSSGVNFLQNDWGTPVDEDDVLAGAAAGLTTWYPPSAQDYVFIVGGEPLPGESRAATEAAVDARIASLRDAPLPEAAVSTAVGEVLDALAFDVQTTEDAAHQLAFFAGLDALDVLLDLPHRLRAVTPADVRAVARRYLGADQRAIAWYLPGPPAPPTGAVMTPAPPTRQPPVHAPATTAIPSATTVRLESGLPVLLQASDFSPTVDLRLVLDGDGRDGTLADDTVTGHAALVRAVPRAALADAIDAVARRLATLPAAAPPASDSLQPAIRLEQEFTRLMGTSPETAAPAPRLVSLAGDFDRADTLAALERALGATPPASSPPSAAPPVPAGERTVHLGVPLAQAQLGYIVSAPGPETVAADAWQLLLYVLAHDYEGRLGTKAISEAGLAYYIDARYRSDGRNAWVTLSTGVDPGKLPALRALLADELARLVREPPAAAELAAARQHFLGRFDSAAQSNAELAARLAKYWLWYGSLPDRAILEARLARVDAHDLAAAATGLASGLTLTIVR